MSLQIALPSFGTRAVIVEARRRQRRRRTTLAAVVALMLAASIGLVAYGHRGTSRPVVVKVYFAPGATIAQIRRTITAARAEHGVGGVNLVTKEAALAELKRRYPALVSGLAYNPLPSSIQVRVSAGDARRLVADLRRAQPTTIVSAIKEAPAGP